MESLRREFGHSIPVHNVPGLGANLDMREWGGRRNRVEYYINIKMEDSVTFLSSILFKDENNTFGGLVLLSNRHVSPT